MDRLHARNAWTPDGWLSGISLAADARGRLASADGDAGGEAVDWLLPGVANLHSHAFQRAMAGLAERQTHPEDSFWTWRELMYRFAGRIDPEAQYAIAAQLYVEMLEAGYTSVCEFHYLHHQPDGRPYGERAAMAQAIIQAARDTGIRLTLLPVLYMTGGFDGRPLSERQRRFGHSVEGFLSLLQDLRAQQDDFLRIGIALHSLRAVPADALRAVLQAVAGEDFPIHIHIAEQVAEVHECLLTRGTRPLRWLLDHAEVGPRWCLVHATHLDAGEVQGIARSGATVAVCTSTEANLGDGVFPLPEFLAAGGRFGVGSDSHVSVSPVEELRWLEYGQRLWLRQRNIAVTPARLSTGEQLFAACQASAAQAGGWPLGGLAVGQCADLVALDAAAPALAGAAPADLLDRWCFAGNRPLVDRVWVGGRQRVRGGRHVARERHAAAYADCLRRLLAE